MRRCFPFVHHTIKFIFYTLFTMPNHKAAKKAVRQSERRRDRNHYYKKTTRSAIKRLRSLTDSADAAQFLPRVVSMIDRLAKRNIFHRNKAANLKSKLMRFVQALSNKAS